MIIKNITELTFLFILATRLDIEDEIKVIK